MKKIILTILLLGILVNSAIAEEIALLQFNTYKEETPGANKQVGDVYRFENVSTGVDALIKIVQFNNGASLDTLDETSSGWDDAFQPTLQTGEYQDSSVDFEISFVEAGTTVPKPISFKATGADIDGDGGSVREYISLTSPDSYTLENPTRLSLSSNESKINIIPSTTENVAGITVTETRNIITASYINVSTIYYSIGATNANSTKRWNSLYFKDVSYNNETVIETVPCGVVNYSTSGSNWIEGTNALAYDDNLDIARTIEMSNTTELRITVSGKVEDDQDTTNFKYDWIVVYDENGQEVYKGDATLDETPFIVSGNKVTIELHSDTSVNASGVTVKVEGMSCQDSSYDFGDAPTEYPHVSHKISDTLYMGNIKPDGENDQQISLDSTGDGADDNDGIISALSPVIIDSTSYTTSVKVFNNSNSNAYLTAWIDFNRNGVFEFNEALNNRDLIVPSSSSSQNVDITWDNFTDSATYGINNAQLGKTTMRIRLTSSRVLRCAPEHYANGTDLNYGGNYFVSPDGEVEDYEVVIQDGNVQSTATCYALTDNGNKLYKVAMSPGASILPIASTINLTDEFNGEGSAYRASNNKFYAFKAAGDDQGPSSLYSIDVLTGAISLVKNNIIDGSVDGAEFYFDPATNKEILYIISGENDSLLYAFDTADWSPLANYPKNTNTDLSSLAIDPITGIGYAIDDYNYHGVYPPLYSLNLATGSTTFLTNLQNLADAEGLAFASDGNLYIEDEGRDDLDGERLYQVNISNGELTPAAITNADGDIEGLSCNGTQIAIDTPSISMANNISIIEGNISTSDLNIPVTLNKPALENVTFTYNISNITATAGEDYINEGNVVATIPKGATSVIITIQVNGDSKIEDNETLSINILEASNAIFNSNSVIATIINDDEEEEILELVAEYRFDECIWNGTADEVKDFQGFNHGITYGDTKSIAEGKIGRAAYFDGDEDYITIANDEKLQLTGSASWSLWIKPENLPEDYLAENRQGLLFKHYNNEYELILEPFGVVSFYHGDGTYEEMHEPYAKVNEGVWNHVVITRNAETKTLTWYINGVVIGTDTYVETPEISDNALFIGMRGSNHDFAFKGAMDEIKLFNYALSDSGVQAIYANEDSGKNWDGSTREAVVCEDTTISSVADYQLDECMWDGTNNEVIDNSGNDLHGTTKNETENIQNGVINHAGKFVRTSKNYIELNPLDNVFGDQSSEFTIALWIKPNMLTNDATNHGTKNTFFAKASDPKNDNIEIGINPDGTLHLYLDTKTHDTQTNFGNAGDVIQNQWNFIVVSYKEGTIQVQINLEVYNDATTWSTSTILDQAVGSPLTLGASLHIDNYFDGEIDEVKIFDKQLTTVQINDILNETRAPSTCPIKYSISGKVYKDENQDGTFNTDDVLLSDVEIQLFNDSNNNSSYDEGIDTLITKVRTDSSGTYQFNNLESNNYFVSITTQDMTLPEIYKIQGNELVSLYISNDVSNVDFIFAKKQLYPVNCVENGLMFQNRPTDISYLDLSSGEMLVEKENISLTNINAAGYNKKDGYYWGYKHKNIDGTTSDEGIVARIGKDENGELFAEEFQIENLQVVSYTGDIDNNGHLYLKEGSTRVVVIDLDPESANYLTKINDFNLDESIALADWAFNPQDEKLYAVNNGSGIKYLYKIEPTTGKIISKQDTQLSVERSYGFGASFFDKNGFYYVYDNASGEILRIDVDESPVPVPFAKGSTVSLNDGAMCTDTEIRFDFGDLPNNYATSLEDDGARHRIKTSIGKTHYLGQEISTEIYAKPSITADKDEYDDGVTINGASLQNYFISSKASFSEITIKTHGDGYLNAWIDWNRDGDFNDSEQIANAVPSVNDGIITLSIKPEDIPEISFNGEPIYARFRYSSEENLASTGTAPDGEVEDYRMITEDYVDVRINDVKDTEGNSGTKTFTFTLSFDHPTETNSGLWVTFKDGVNAVAPIEIAGHVDTHDTDEADFSGDAYYIQIPENSLTYEIEAEVIGDNYIEKDEEFYVELYSPNNLTIVDSRGVGTIINDDSPELHIERINSDLVSDIFSIERRELYTQIAGKDFDYSIVSYGTSEGYAINDVTVKIELLDQNTTQQDNSLYDSTYLYLNSTDASSRFNIDNDNDLKLNIVTRKAQFKISYILDENGTLIHGDFSNQEAYENSIKDGNSEKTQYSDTFAIRPASYRIELNDLDENNQTVTYVTNNTQQSEELNLAAEYDYKLKVKAVIDGNFSTATNYKTINSKELNVTLDFNNLDTISCADANTSEIKNYSFLDGQLNETLSHDNVGKYSLHIEDINWTYIDKDAEKLGCVLNSSSNIADNSGRFGCNIASDEGDNFFDIKMTFQPYKFAFSDIKLENINGNGKDYLYMSDLDLSQDMGLNLHSTLVAQGKNDTVLSNFTSGCMATEVKLSSVFTVLYDPNIAEHNNSQNFTLNTIGGNSVQPQNRIMITGDNNYTTAPFNNLTLSSTSFLDENEGNVTIDILYNMQKNFNDTTNPIKVNFLTLDANATSAKAKISNKDTLPKGDGDINQGSRTFYFARVASVMENFPETNKNVINTPLYVELFCKVPGNRAWCDNTMNLNTIGRNTQKTDSGWYLAKEHNSTVDGRVTALVSHKVKTDENDDDINNITIEYANATGITDFIEGKIDGITIKYNQDTLEGKNIADIAIDSDIWLRFNTKNIAGVPTGTSSYSVTFKGISEATGVGKRGYMLQQRPPIERNGKMSW